MISYKVNIKPLSVNQAFQGRRFKTPNYKNYERDLLYLLPKLTLPLPPFEVIYEFGMSNILSDIDNPVKPFQDVLQKKYGFNDASIMKMNVTKVKVAKGMDYIKFKINHLENTLKII